MSRKVKSYNRCLVSFFLSLSLLHSLSLLLCLFSLILIHLKGRIFKYLFYINSPLSFSFPFYFHFYYHLTLMEFLNQTFSVTPFSFQFSLCYSSAVNLYKFFFSFSFLLALLNGLSVNGPTEQNVLLH